MKITESKTYIAIPPGFTIRELLDDQDKSIKEFAHLMGLTEEDATALIEGEIDLTQDMSQKLEVCLGMDAQFWMNLEHLYRTDLIKVAAENAQAAAREEKAHKKATSPVPETFAV